MEPGQFLPSSRSPFVCMPPIEAIAQQKKGPIPPRRTVMLVAFQAEALGGRSEKETGEGLSQQLCIKHKHGVVAQGRFASQHNDTATLFGIASLAGCPGRSSATSIKYSVLLMGRASKQQFR